MANTREVISLQFGHYSNHVGAHFWNIEELAFDYMEPVKTAVNNDILFREGLTSDGKVTYTPRLILADLKNSLRCLPADGGLEENDPETLEWHETEKMQEDVATESNYQKSISSNPQESLDNVDLSDISTWTDYLYPRFHHRTINVINQYKHNDSVAPFETFSAGCNVWKNEQYSEMFSDNIRHYAEECDNLQGFQILLDCTDGFGGLASGCLDFLCDQYTNKAIFAVPLIPPHFSDRDYSNATEREISHQKDLARLVNIALTHERLFEYATLFVPACCKDGWRSSSVPRTFYNVNYNVNRHYESSAILASALNTISLKYRLKDSNLHLFDICADMSGYNRKLAAMSLGLPFHMKQKDYLIDHLNNMTEPFWKSVTPHCNIPTDKMFQHISIRGIPERKLKRPPDAAKDQLKLAAYQCKNVKEMFEYYFQCNYFLTATNVTVTDVGMNIKTPFPKIFSEDLDKYGFVKEFVDNAVVDQIPVICGLHNGDFLFDTIETLYREVKRIKNSKLQRFYNDGLEQEDFNDAMAKLDEAKSYYSDEIEL